MRRFLIWSGLAVVIGLVLAIGGYLAYDFFYARFQPVTIARNQAEIQRLLDEASWVSPGGGDQPLYVIGFRDSPSTQAYEREEVSKLRAGGVDVRTIVFARPDREGMAQSTAAERATVAELWLNRDWDLYQRWAATPSSRWTAVELPQADGSLARTAVVEAGRDFIRKLDEQLRDAGVRPTWPLVIWRDREGFLKACACADRRSWAFVRDDLNAPDRVAAAPPPAPETPMTPEPTVIQPPTPPQMQGLPYPSLPSIPPVDNAAPPPTTPAPAPTPQRTAPAPSRPAQNAAPRPTRPTPPAPRRPTTPPPIPPEDTQFF